MNAQPDYSRPNKFNPEAMADIVEDQYIRREFSAEEKEDMANVLADNSVKLGNLSQELKEVQADFKVKMDPLKNSNKKIVDDLRRGYEEEKLRVYGVANHDNGMMEFFTIEGEMVNSRKLLPNEKQLKLKS